MEETVDFISLQYMVLGVYSEFFEQQFMPKFMFFINKFHRFTGLFSHTISHVTFHIFITGPFLASPRGGGVEA